MAQFQGAHEHEAHMVSYGLIGLTNLELAHYKFPGNW